MFVRKHGIGNGQEKSNVARKGVPIFQKLLITGLSE
jgi:hypothetical protein